MTPEEIEELRALAVRLRRGENHNMAAILEAALEHIDQQDAKIAALEAEVKRLSEPNACDDWGNPVVLGCAGGSNDKL